MILRLYLELLINMSFLRHLLDSHFLKSLLQVKISKFIVQEYISVVNSLQQILHFCGFSFHEQEKCEMCDTIFQFFWLGSNQEIVK